MKNLKIGMRLGIGFGTIILMMIVVATVGINRLSANGSTVDRVVNDTYKKVALLNDLTRESDVGARNLRNAMLARNPEEAAKFIDAIAVSSKKASEANSALEIRLSLPKGKELYKAMSVARAQYIVMRGTVVKLIKEGRKEEATDFLFKEILPVYASYTAATERLLDFEKELMDSDSKIAINQANSASRTMMVLSAFATALAIFFGLFLTRSIVGPVHEALRVADTVASGDLTSHIESTANDETGLLLHALRKMNENLVKIVTEVRTGTNTIATASSQIAVGNLDLSSRTEQQASSLEETASSMEELTSTVKQNADNARQANQLALAASDIATKGGFVITQVVDTMGAINDSAKKIVDIISVVDGIAFQTNILALNAAVEAARAGEQGRGFAVVATEVRSLAQRSAAAAKEIKELIGNSVEKVDAGSKLAARAGSTMDEIVTSVKRVTDMMAEITAASQEQSVGIEQVNKAISQMDQVTQQNAALVEEAAAAAESLQDQSAQLAQAVSVFQLDQSRTAVAAVIPASTHGHVKGKASPSLVLPRNDRPGSTHLRVPTRENATTITAADSWEEF